MAFTNCINHKQFLSVSDQWSTVVGLDSGFRVGFKINIKFSKIVENMCRPVVASLWVSNQSVHTRINLQCYKLVTDLWNKFKNEQLFTWTDFIQTLKRALSFDEKKSRFHKSWNKCINSICFTIYNYPGYLWREQNVTVKKSKGKWNFWSYLRVVIWWKRKSTLKADFFFKVLTCSRYRSL